MQSKLTYLAVAAIAASIGAGCSKGSDQTSSSSTTTTTTATAAPAIATPAALASVRGDGVHGKSIFGAKCAACHGATGTEGGVGPSLKNEKSRKNYDQTVAWIKNPEQPMPKLYPAEISAKDVDDVAAFVQSL
ncbi:MAG TPA: cytochrome c [Candidatus Elarobacter sp.]|nr:cytochrome c [Candidatus Elarobacter sp.]